MGQQQLLLLVLSTVIVGLATVAGIQAFSENQAQATQDALVQRSISLAAEMKAAHDKPSQFGGVDLTDSPGKSAIADAIGVSQTSGIPADGAGENASCEIKTTIQNSQSITGDASIICAGSGGEVEAVVDVSASDPVQIATISVAS